MRRLAFVLLGFAGCLSGGGSDGSSYGDYSGDVVPPPGGGGGGACTHDSDCISGEVCADTRECAMPSDLQKVSIHWTIAGQPPDDTACAPSPYLVLQVGAIGFAPVRCVAGTFTFLKLPTWDSTVQFQPDVTDGTATISSITTTGGDIPLGGGDVTVDLTFGP